MTIFRELTGVCWLVFGAYWFVSSFNAKRNLRSASGARGTLLRVVVVVAVLALARTPAFATLGRVTTGPALGAVGVALCALGIGFAIWARASLGSNWGMPMTVKESPDLVTDGPYAVVRHPIYGGMLTAMLGTMLALGLASLVILVPVAAFFVYSARIEEKRLLEAFPDEYPEYHRRTRMLVPYLF